MNNGIVTRLSRDGRGVWLPCLSRNDTSYITPLNTNTFMNTNGRCHSITLILHTHLVRRAPHPTAVQSGTVANPSKAGPQARSHSPPQPCSNHPCSTQSRLHLAFYLSQSKLTIVQPISPPIMTIQPTPGSFSDILPSARPAPELVVDSTLTSSQSTRIVQLDHC